MESTPRRVCSRTFRFVLAASLTCSALLYVPFTWHWPLVGDASLIHYIAFLIERGWVPYRQLGDMNMPGSFLIELAAMHLYGPGALAWRLFDFTVIFAGVAACFAICKRRNWLAALFAGSLLVLIHGRDGLAQGGQRDLTMAVCLLGAAACLLAVVRSGSVMAACGFGLLSGIAITIKPTALLLTVLQVGVVWIYSKQRWATTDSMVPKAVIAGSVGWLVAPVICVLFLLRERAVEAFLGGFHGLVPYYASLGHRPLGFVLTHGLSPIEPLAGAWLVVLLLRRVPGREYLTVTHALLLAGVLFGVANCVLQHRALPYYRYPLLAFLLPLIGLDLLAATDAPNEASGGSERPGAARWQYGRALALVALGFGGLWVAPQSAVLIHRYRWYQTEMLDSLQQSLRALGGSRLSGQVQCIDSISGCGTVLYRMRLEPATGILSDFTLFGNTTDLRPAQDIPLIRDTRAQFLSALAAHPPAAIVITSHLHMTGPDDFGKLDLWPALEQVLAAKYSLSTEWHPSRTERWWSREEFPAAYRIYVLKPR